MPPSFAGGDQELYLKSLRDSLPMFTKDGISTTDGAM